MWRIVKYVKPRIARPIAISTFLGVSALFALVSCGGGSDETSTVIFPAWIENSNSQIRAAYEFAVARPDVLQYVPCYCGCGSMGHTHNEDCFVARRIPDGSIVFDQHGYT